MVAESHGGNETRDLPGKGNDLSRPRSEHRVERVAPEDRRPLPHHEPDEGERGATETPQERAQRRRRRLLIAAVVGALLLVGAIVPGWYWYTTWRWLEATDDAYTQADNTAIGPKVSRLHLPIAGDRQPAGQGGRPLAGPQRQALGDLLR